MSDGFGPKDDFILPSGYEGLKITGGGGEEGMKRAYLYTTTALIVVTLFIANSAIGAGYGEDWDKAWTVATCPENIIGPPVFFPGRDIKI